MKGIIFTELLNLVEEKFGYEMVDRMISGANLENDGAYTAIGTYDHSDLLKMVAVLTEQTDVAAPVLVKAFGKHLFQVFAAKHRDTIHPIQSTFEMIEQVEGFIHVEVRKIYPDAQLPTFSFHYENPDTLVVQYRSERPFADVCEGLIEQCIESFGEDIAVERHDVDANGTAANFTLVRQHSPSCV